MTREAFFAHCLDTYGTKPDYPFDDWHRSAVFRHADTRKWYALAMSIPLSKLGVPSEKVVDVVNLKLPREMIGSFTEADGVYPAYHMNKSHWISVSLSLATDDTITFLVAVSYKATSAKKTRKSC